MPIGYSYIRFSSTKQEQGDSITRQNKAFLKVCESLDLTPFTKPYEDLGVSAWRGKNKDEGNLSAFIQACQGPQRTVKPGDYLVIEKLDRASRESPIKVLALIQSILETGVKIATASPMRVYDSTSLEDPFTLIEIVILATRAKEESDTKSERVKSAWAGKYENADKELVTARLPAWCCIDEVGKVKLVPERAAIIKNMFKWATTEGIGQRAIAKRLNVMKVPTWGGGKAWNYSYVRLILLDKRVTGAAYGLNDYLPQVITPEVFERVTADTANRIRFRGAKGEKVANLFNGLAYDTDTGSTMVVIKKRPQAPYRYIPSAYVTGKSKESLSFPYELFERAFLVMVEGLTVKQLIGTSDLAQKLEGQKEDIENQITKVDTRLHSLRRALQDAEELTTVLDAIKDLEAKRKALHGTLEAIKLDIAGVHPAGLAHTKHLLMQLQATSPEELPALRNMLKTQIRTIVQRIDCTITRNGWTSRLEAAICFKSGRKQTLTLETRRGKLTTLESNDVAGLMKFLSQSSQQAVTHRSSSQSDKTRYSIRESIPQAGVSQSTFDNWRL